MMKIKDGWIHMWSAVKVIGAIGFAVWALIWVVKIIIMYFTWWFGTFNDSNGIVMGLFMMFVCWAFGVVIGGVNQ